MAAPIETKVTAGSLSAAAAGVALWALSTYVFKGSDVPAGLVSLVYLLVPALIAGAGAYLAPHTHRPDLVPVPRPPDLVERFNDPSLTGTEAKPPAPAGPTA